MANEPQVLEGGLFIDPEGKLVHQEPEHGIQIVAPGGTVDDAARGRLKAEFDLDRVAVDAILAEHGSPVDVGDGLDQLKKDELEALAAEQDPPVDISGAKSNGERVDALRAAGVTAAAKGK